MATIEWRLDGAVQLRVECPREVVDKRIDAERRAGTRGQIYIDNIPLDERDIRLAELEETVKFQSAMLQKMMSKVESSGAANPDLEEILTRLRHVEERMAGGNFPWRREFLRSLMEITKEEVKGHE